MKKDIQIPKVKDVYIAIVKEFNDTHKTEDWNVCIINDKDVDLEIVIIVTKGYNATKITSTFRKRIDILPRKSYAKIEMIQEGLFALNNEFKVSFFVENKMFDKTYLFRKNTINEKALQSIPLIESRGVLVK
ncbi:hypothetical protein [Winogradskyella sp.]|uniref:hypothetical protein n=1 Tax=Winogradskyella sp. TaxID=1883156 RepID=UPI0035C817D7